MASVVDICNLSLSHLGDRATLASIDPPEGSAQADHCAQWWPIARDEALAAYDWKFARGVSRPAQLDASIHTDPEWLYSFALPPDFLAARYFSYDSASPSLQALYPGSPLFDMTTLASGEQVMLANDTGMALLYTRRVSDPARYSPKFVTAISYLLASYLAGPVVKGKTAVQMAAAMRNAWERLASSAAVTDANQNHNGLAFKPAGVRARGGTAETTTIERGQYRYELPFWAQ